MVLGLVRRGVLRGVAGGESAGAGAGGSKGVARRGVAAPCEVLEVRGEEQHSTGVPVCGLRVPGGGVAERPGDALGTGVEFVIVRF